VVANPGYGKTTLSSVIIEDIQSELYTLVGGSAFPRNVVFFHFAIESPEANDLSQALRSMLVQALHINRYNKDFVDALSMLMDCAGTGQEIASEEDVRQAFLFFAARLPGMFIIIDGVDECIEYLELFHYMCTICKASLIKFVLLARPNINIPNEYEYGITRMELTVKDNLGDIECFLRPEVEHLQASNTIAGDLPNNAIVARIASRANGMFLWAYLMIKYLQSPGLSPSEKREAILETHLVEGLDTMYERILRGLEQNFARVRENVHRIFQILITAIRPLRARELQAALAIQPGSATATDNYLLNFEKTLVVISGALVEVGIDNTVRFIHSSAGEFLERRSTSNEQPSPQFYVDRVAANVLFATICLTTLNFDMPSKTRNLHANALANTTMFSSSPFLRYAALHWPAHINNALLNYDKSPTEKYVASWDQLLLGLSSFLRNPITVTYWIEVMWTLGTSPRLTQLVKTIKLIPLRLLFPSTLGSSQGLIVIRLLCKFSDDLLMLNKDWSRVLAENPSAIWGPHVPAFSKSEFWVETNETKVTFLGHSDSTSTSNVAGARGRDEVWITVASQTSSDGKIISVLSVKPST
jgi:hypothetical protein